MAIYNYIGIGGLSMAGSGLPGVPIKKPVIPNVPLPMLNWVPVRNPGQTIFKVSGVNYIY